MIKATLVFLKNRLNTHFEALSGDASSEVWEDKVVFLDGEKMDPVVFKLGAVSALLMNLEEEKILRNADPFRTRSSTGTPLEIQPEIRLNLYILFVARFKLYEQGLDALSKIIQYFQHHRVLNHENAPGLDSRIERLILELKTLPFSEQNEIWSALRTTYHPSVLYKVRMMVFRDETPKEAKEIKTTLVEISRKL